MKCLTIEDLPDIWYLTDEAICEIINKCPEIRSIRFSDNPGLTDTTIDALIWLAEKKPFCHFVHSFSPKPDYIREENYIMFATNREYKTLPENLDLIPFDFKIFSIFGTNTVEIWISFE